MLSQRTSKGNKPKKSRKGQKVALERQTRMVYASQFQWVVPPCINMHPWAIRRPKFVNVRTKSIFCLNSSCLILATAALRRQKWPKKGQNKSQNLALKRQIAAERAAHGGLPRISFWAQFCASRTAKLRPKWWAQCMGRTHALWTHLMQSPIKAYHSSP